MLPEMGPGKRFMLHWLVWGTWVLFGWGVVGSFGIIWVIWEMQKNGIKTQGGVHEILDSGTVGILTGNPRGGDS